MLPNKHACTMQTLRFVGVSIVKILCSHRHLGTHVSYLHSELVLGVHNSPIYQEEAKMINEEL